MNKGDLRKQFLAKRRALSAAEVERRSGAIREILLSADIFQNKMSALTIHTFLPIAHQNEVDTWLIIHQLWQQRPMVQIAVSITDPVGKTLTHYPLTPSTRLTNNRWGIPEPEATGVSIKPTAFDWVLVPLLAVDQRGHRVGYGGGFYDRFMAQCRPDCRKVGLSLFEPVDEIIDVDETDIQLDGCVTPLTYIDFNA